MVIMVSRAQSLPLDTYTKPYWLQEYSEDSLHTIDCYGNCYR